MERVLAHWSPTAQIGRRDILIVAAYHRYISNSAWSHENATVADESTVVQRGEAWLLQCIHHTAGIYSFFANLIQATRREPEQALCWWETGVMCERRYRVGEQWYNLKPDALAEYRVGSQQVRFWLEWDRGTMNVRDLAVKFTSYAHYVASREWAREHSMLPVLVCVAPDIAQQRRMQRVAQARLTSPHGLMVWTTTRVLLDEQGPLAPIWLQSIPQSSQAAQSGNVLRQCMFDVIPAKYGREGDGCRGDSSHAAR